MTSQKSQFSKSFCRGWLCLLTMGTFNKNNTHMVFEIIYTISQFCNSQLYIFQYTFLCLFVILSLWMGGQAPREFEEKDLMPCGWWFPFENIFWTPHMNYEIPDIPHPMTSISVCRLMNKVMELISWGESQPHDTQWWQGVKDSCIPHCGCTLTCTVLITCPEIPKSKALQLRRSAPNSPSRFCGEACDEVYWCKGTQCEGGPERWLRPPVCNLVLRWTAHLHFARRWASSKNVGLKDLLMPRVDHLKQNNVVHFKTLGLSCWRTQKRWIALHTVDADWHALR